MFRIRNIPPFIPRKLSRKTFDIACQDNQYSFFIEFRITVIQKLRDIIEYEIKPLTKQYFFAKKDEEFLKKINQHFDRMVEVQSLDTHV